MDSAKQQELLSKVKELYERDDFNGIINLLGPLLAELDFTLGIELARAYINEANAQNATVNSSMVSVSDELYEHANSLLDRYASEGKDNATYLFYKGYALFKLGLLSDAALRLERAQRFIKLGSEDALLSKINKMLALCQSYDPDNKDLVLSKENEQALDEHIVKSFGKYTILFKTDRYELLDIAPTKEHPWHLILTKGVSGRKLKVPAGVDELTNSRIELALCLPKGWEFQNSEGYNLWPVNTLCSLINYVLTTDEFIGFGYAFSQQKPWHPTTDFTGGMLTALGGYGKQVQEMVLPDQSYVRFFELIFLNPLEVAYRQNHGANELLELFAKKQVVLSPVHKRPDACAVPAHVTKI